MFKVMIIDDEPIIRKGIKNILNWEKFDCEVCAEASDGEEGKILIEKYRPDILITDIRMPGTDGLKMISEVKALIPDCKIIVLTGYRDFDYVQEALKLGVFDFVLKPSKIEELTTIIHRAVEELKKLKNRAEEFNKLKKLFEQNIPILREKFLYDLMYEIYPNTEEILPRAELLGVKIESFFLLVVEIDTDENKKLSQYEKNLYLFGIVNTFMDVFSDSFSVIDVPLKDRGVAFILQGGNEKEKLHNLISDKCNYLQELLINCFGFTVTVAVSSEGRGIMQLPEKFRECIEALERKFYIGNGTVIFYNDMSGFLKFEDYSVLEEYQKLLLDGIKTGNEAIVMKRIEDIKKYINSLDHLNMEYLKNFYWGIITYINNIRLSVAMASNESKVESINIISLHNMISKSENINELNDLLKEVSLSITAKINNYNNKSIKLILRNALEYIHQHYSEQLTLNDVAEHVYVSPSYLSRMFKKELGKNFVDYLNGLRIEKAKELLMDPKYKTYEVAEIVGIPDAHYFSRLFKKYEGLSPTEYRDASMGE
ncbi:Two component transcriptional regulator, AraC family [Thermoclostridium stercorarium subsp. stercorarium DSM 8532]|uniref:Stage 0 sporulation protein A homolog n=2 Tax=Thermoclostridium stercorarium TaxID=1510 RepID=L7VN05_THES1|nr:response regulator transcription factor [Thermoclostridium stercorarium]AGC69605.1 Two component transcriptional regulator, AraC family [Thermoclostridium stercorarium subsp. stercorarium DSM 8532]AGI40556.1 transcriptional regulator [Thermoclostridium stercorarium subsp. stercorarium DSM 8532]ANW99834.1 DNA-binding response regulator [Thermoclostridium stercorarium subsp. thermolacticum DSM 2910]